MALCSRDLSPPLASRASCMRFFLVGPNRCSLSRSHPQWWHLLRRSRQYAYHSRPWMCASSHRASSADSCSLCPRMTRSLSSAYVRECGRNVATTTEICVYIYIYICVFSWHWSYGRSRQVHVRVSYEIMTTHPHTHTHEHM